MHVSVCALILRFQFTSLRHDFKTISFNSFTE